MADCFCNCSRVKSLPSPGRALTPPGVGWGGGLHLENGGPGAALHLGVKMTTELMGWLLHPSQWQILLQRYTAVLDPKKISRVEQKQEAGLFLNPNNEIRTPMLIWVANTCKLATVRFLSVEKCGEGEKGEARRTQGSRKNDVLSLLVAFFMFCFSSKGSQLCIKKHIYCTYTLFQTS